MNVLVDTCVWSLALRRRKGKQDPAAGELGNLIRDHRAVILGPIRQELLAGVRDPDRFRLLRDRLRAFPDLPLTAEDYEQAAELANTCRSHGVQGSPTDFLICAAAARHGLVIFTVDADFSRFIRHLPITLH